MATHAAALPVSERVHYNWWGSALMGLRFLSFTGALLSCWLSCSGEGSPANSGTPPSPDAATHDDELIMAFTTSTCGRHVECQNPSASQCRAFTEQQIRQALPSVSWTSAQLQQCTADRRRLVACILAADCAAILALTDCVSEKQEYAVSCEPLLTALNL
jgi:hypothetical protein